MLEYLHLGILLFLLAWRTKLSASRFFKIATSEESRLMPTLPRLEITFETGKLVKELPVCGFNTI
jgi:hypothetical protein